MNLNIHIEDNQKVILSANTGKSPRLENEPELFRGKAKNLAREIKKAPNGNYWLSIVNIEETKELLLTIKIKKKIVTLDWPQKGQI